jgi:molybdopterin molybdotransferase
MAAAGHDGAEVYQSPKNTIIATGDEIVAIGKPLEHGKVFASNLVTLSAWCALYGIHAKTVVVRDKKEEPFNAVRSAIADSDCLITPSMGGPEMDEQNTGQDRSCPVALPFFRSHAARSS